MSWCREHLSECIFTGEGNLKKELCAEDSGKECTLVHVILAVHRRPPEVRRRLIAALYPAYGLPAGDDVRREDRPRPSAAAPRPRRRRPNPGDA